jgi:hypothetical protein
VFGWGEDLGEHLGRFGLAAILANGSFFLTRTAIDWNNQLCEAIGFATLPGAFVGVPGDALSYGILALALLFFGLQLSFKMLYRIGMLWILIATAPLALACWAIPQAQWVATTWTRHFVGWTFGQVLVTLALKFGLQSGPFGGTGTSYAGLIFAIVMAALACDLVDVLVYGSVPRFNAVGNVARFAVFAKNAALAATSRMATQPTLQRRLPGL